ncbi:MAG: ATP-binding protein [Acidobacteriota bacterium]
MTPLHLERIIGGAWTAGHDGTRSCWFALRMRLVFAALIAALIGTLITGTALVLLLVRREARVSRLQADFVSNVSHELRTPLTSISMFVETLRMGRAKDPEQVSLCLDALARETARLREEIERLLDWGRMQAGRKVYARRPEPMGPVVQEAADAMRQALDARRQQLTVQIPGQLPAASIDRPAIVGSLINLLTNASKYSEEGMPVELGAAANSHSVRIWVRDRGIGIPPSEHRNVFKQFYRVEDRASRGVEGSGLGLAIVRHVVRAHEGHIELESEPGRGSTFTIVLPAIVAPAEGRQES